jgi:hypothetical protein
MPDLPTLFLSVLSAPHLDARPPNTFSLGVFRSATRKSRPRPPTTVVFLSRLGGELDEDAGSVGMLKQ